MTKLRNIFALFLLLGLIFAELLPTINNFDAIPAKSQSSSAEQSLLRSLLESSSSSSASLSNSPFIDINLPQSPSEVSKDMQYSSSLLLGPFQNPSPTANETLLPAASLSQQNQLLQTVLPTIGSELYYAYQDGGKAWYQKGDNVLVIFSDETIRSFNRQTGVANTWLQKELAYAPIDDADAIENYQKNYNAKQVAETSSWVLMEFPSGGVLKVVKPSYATSNKGGGTPGNLPSVLPGYN